MRLLNDVYVNKWQISLIIVLLCLSSFLAAIPAQVLGMLANSLAGTGQSDAWLVDSWQIIGVKSDPKVMAVLGFGILFLIVSFTADVVRNIFCAYVLWSSEQISHLSRMAVLKSALKRTTILGSNAKFTRDDFIDGARLEVSRFSSLTSTMLFTAGSDIVDSLVMLFLIAVTVNWICLPVYIVGMPLLAVISHLVAKRQALAKDQWRAADGALKTRVHIAVGQIETVRATCADEYEYKQLEDLSNRYRNSSFAMDAVAAKFFPFSALTRNVITVVAIVIYALTSSQVTAGAILVLFAYSIKIFAPLNNFINYSRRLEVGRSALHRLRELSLAGEPLPPALMSPITSLEITCVHKTKLEDAGTAGDINAYDSAEFCQKVTLHPSQVLWVRGPSGSGKTTLLRMIAGVLSHEDYAQIVKSNFEVKGITAKGEEISGYELRGMADYVSQNPMVIPGTLLENVDYPNRQIPLKERVAVLRRLGFRDDQIYSEETVTELTLSGGEQRRLGLARASLGNNTVLILDEFDSNLDAQSKQIVRAYIKELSSKRIVIIVSHDPDVECWLDGIKTITL